MTPFLTTSLAARLQRRTVDATYTDTAYYLAAPSMVSLDEYGQPTPSTAETLFKCSFTDKPAAERWRDVDIQQIDAEIRFASPAPTKGGKVRISKRFNEVVVSRTFEIVGIQDRGAFGYVCALKEIVL